LATCRRAMTKGAYLILVERYLPEDPREALPVHHADLEMLVNVGGLERTTDEYARLLERSGFRLSRTIPLGRAKEAMGHYLIEAQPV
ncbi:MAG TPA: methyltransferase, partial [Stellaceae bacterium]|nr:methyltransferase [Stellaceae bacterium]